MIILIEICLLLYLVYISLLLHFLLFLFQFIEIEV